MPLPSRPAYESDRRHSINFEPLGGKRLRMNERPSFERLKLAYTCKLFGIEYHHLRDSARVSAAFQSEDRSSLLTWTHHREVAGREDKAELLQWAIDSGNRLPLLDWSHHREVAGREDHPEWTQQRIADEVGVTQGYVARVITKPCESQEKVITPPHLNGDHEKADYRKLPHDMREAVGRWLRRQLSYSHHQSNHPQQR
jgi:hypothetical protein